MSNKYLNTLLTEQKTLKQQEAISVVSGKYHLKRGNQARATYFFMRANDAFVKRTIIEERLQLIAIAVAPSAEQFVKPIVL
jgi:hypothetical protein